MKVLIFKKLWMFLLTLTFLISSKANSNADVLSLIGPLSDEEVRIIHRALNNKCQVEWEKEFKLNTSNRKERTRKVLSFLTAVYKMKVARSKQEFLYYLQSFYGEKSSELDPIKSQYKKFMEDRWQDKQAKLESREATLKGLLRNSIRDDLETFECLTKEPDDLDGFVILGGEPTITSQPLKIEPLVVDSFASMSSFSSSSSSSSSSAASSSAPPISISSTPLDDVSDEAEVLLSMLDEKSAKIALRARLNNYQIPFAEFDFNNSEGAIQCNNVCEYLKYILQKKINNILEKKGRFSSGSPQDNFYTVKQEKYEGIITFILVSFSNKIQSPPPFHPASSSSGGKSSRSKARK